MRSLLALMRHLWRVERAGLLAGMAASTATVLAGMALLGLSGWFITASALAGGAGIGLAFDFFRPSAGIRFLALARTACRYTERLVTHNATLRFLTEMRVALFRGYARLDHGRATMLRSAQMLYRLSADVDAVDNLLLRIIVPSAVFVLWGGALALALMSFSPAISLLVVCVLVAGLSIVVATGAAAQKDARRRGLALEAVQVRTVDLVRAQAELAVAGGLPDQCRKALQAAERVAHTNRRLALIQLVGDGAVSVLAGVCLMGTFLLAQQSYAAGAMDAPQLVLVVLVAFGVLESIGPLRRGALEVGRTALAARRLMPVIGRAVPRPARATPVPHATAAVEFSDVEFRFSPDRAPVLEHVNLAVQPGEWIAVTGASGAGKSTLLALAAGLVEPTGGKILLHGRSAVLGSGAAGLLTQRTELLRDTVAANLRLAAPSAADAQLWAALEAVELAQVVRDMPLGLATELGEGGSGLSGGEARRLALARLVLMSPHVWLLDEPTAGLDNALACRVLANLKRVAVGSAVLFTTHRTAEWAVADRVIEIRAGRLLDASQSVQRGLARNASCQVSA